MSEEKLIRGIGRWDFTALIINGIIGAGIFGLPSKVFAQIGAWSLLAFAACSIIIGLVVLCYAEVASRFTATGGSYLYAREAFGPAVGFECGWLFWIVRVATFAANANLFATYFGFFIPGANEGSMRIVCVSVIAIIITLVNLWGVRESAMMTNIMTVGKLLPLLVFVAVGLFYIRPENFTFDAVPQYSSFSSAVLLLIYAFVGFEGPVVIAGETKEPKRIVPFGLIAGILIVTVLYILIQFVSIGTLPSLAVSERPLAEAGAIFLGPLGAGMITFGILISIFGNINTGLLTATRALFAMSEQRDLPPVFEKTHPKFKTPHIAILFTAVVMLFLAIQTSFLTAVSIATIARLLFYASTCLALPIFRRRKTAPPAHFIAPLGVVAAFLSIVLIVWLLTNVDYAKEGLAVIIAATAGLIIFAGFRMFTRSVGTAKGKAEGR